jgi:hypothetical protein
MSDGSSLENSFEHVSFVYEFVYIMSVFVPSSSSRLFLLHLFVSSLNLYTTRVKPVSYTDNYEDNHYHYEHHHNRNNYKNKNNLFSAASSASKKSRQHSSTSTRLSDKDKDNSLF